MYALLDHSEGCHFWSSSRTQDLWRTLRDLSRYKFGIMFYVYVLISGADGQLYTGSTTDLKRRLSEHNTGKVRSTFKRRPLNLLYYEACLDESDARRREKYLKTGMGKRYLKQRLRNSLPKFVTGWNFCPLCLLVFLFCLVVLWSPYYLWGGWQTVPAVRRWRCLRWW